MKAMTHSDALRKNIARAVRVFQNFGPAGGTIFQLLLKFRETIDETEALMISSGAVEACSLCARRSSGSCCFKEMGESYDFEQLYCNLLLGCSLPTEADAPDTCHFLGRNGCLLKAKHSFCLNYFCPDLRKTLGADTLDRIQRLVGEQLLAGWELERVLALWLAGVDRPDEFAAAPADR
ncbi:MAG: hypothetical protein LLG06_14415 [Desulfobacteraceae bacterium]|nr:hypothetical protein [Desulfobacteraceae bacterium]